MNESNARKKLPLGVGRLMQLLCELTEEDARVALLLVDPTANVAATLRTRAGYADVYGLVPSRRIAEVPGEELVRIREERQRSLALLGADLRIAEEELESLERSIFNAGIEQVARGPRGTVMS